MSKHIISTTNLNYKNASTPPSKFPIKPLTNPKNILSEKEHGFTLIELIVVIIIVGILAAVGISQYSLTVEKSRLAEAKIRIGAMRQLAYEYWLKNGTLEDMENADVGAGGGCQLTDFYYYSVSVIGSTGVRLTATRCTSGGKTPNTSSQYIYFMQYYPGTGQQHWACHYSDGSTCFGLPAF